MADEDNKQDGQEQLPECIPALDDAIKDLPEDAQKNVRKIFYSRASLSMHGIMPMSNPLYEKMDASLISKMIDNSENESKREYEQEKFNRKCGIIILSIVLVAAIFLLCVFRHHVSDISEIIMPIIYIGVGAVGGFAGGYGIGKSQGQKF